MVIRRPDSYPRSAALTRRGQSPLSWRISWHHFQRDRGDASGGAGLAQAGAQ
jgi:hypothetical protein